jgi:D-3-phosphoglycerate dehydrogenase / 2-oxoglutarate reductase
MANIAADVFPETSFPKNEIEVLLLENIHPSAHELFRGEGFKLEVRSGAMSEAELLERVGSAHIIGIRSKTNITAPVLEKARRLLAVGCFCIGTNQVDLKAANRLGIPVFNAPLSNTRSVAELVLAEIVLLSRRLGDANTEMHSGKWNKSADGANEIRGKTLGIIGYGHIGTQVGVLAESFGLRVLFYDVTAKLPLGNNTRVDSLGDLLALSDYVTLHVPETPHTKNMIDAAALDKMKPGAKLLNLSRGTVVDIKALAAALKSHKLSGAGIDVFPYEPKNNDEEFMSELRGIPNVILTPHIGGSTAEAQDAIGREVGHALIKLVNTGSTVGSVNFPVVEPPPQGHHRVLNVHRNVPGVLSSINRIVSDCNANVVSQVLATDPDIGYLVMDLDRAVAEGVRAAMAQLETSIKTRILY